MTTDQLDIHRASQDELIAAHKNVFDIWSGGRSLEEHLRHRLTSPMSARASWFVGCVEGRVVTSLGCYPLRFFLRGREVAGIAIGSVYTIREFRGRGFAPQLLNWVEQHEAARQAALSVLYSDIEPIYYARLGYQLCPSFEGWREARQELTCSSEGYRLAAASPQEHLAQLMRLYAGYHAGFGLAIARDESYWLAILQKFSDDVFHVLEAPDGSWAGYVRVGWRGSDWRIIDYALASHSGELAQRMYAALLQLAQSSSVRRVGGWLPKTPEAEKFFALEPRRSEITMVKPLDSTVIIDEAMIRDTTHFCEIDHV